MTSYSYDKTVNIPGKIEIRNYDGFDYTIYKTTIDGITYELYNIKSLQAEEFESFTSKLNHLLFEVVKNSKELQREEIENSYNEFKTTLTKKLPSIFNDYRDYK